jgi:hypothetical protein
LIVIDRNGLRAHVITAVPALAEPPTPSPRPHETASPGIASDLLEVGQQLVAQRAADDLALVQPLDHELHVGVGVQQP